MSLLEAALAWAGRGFRVFPLAPGTKIPPKDFAWKAEATTDPARLTAWWSADPSYNIGVATGGGLVVVDVDTRVDGARGALLALDLPDDTLTVRTPGGGFHLYYLGDDVANSAGKLGRGIDVRGVGGYVVAPGSYFADSDGAKGYKGHYALERDLPPVTAPPDLILRAGAPREKQDGGPVSIDDPMDVAYAIRYLQVEAPPAIEGQGGNNTAYQVAARLHEIGLSAEVATDLLAEHWNPRCAPPWEHGDLVRFAAHAELYAQNRQGSGGLSQVAEEFSGAAVPLDEQEPEPTAPRDPLLEGADLLDAPFPDWLIEDIIPEQGLGLLAGQSRVGKSLMALRLARAVMTGEPFCERHIVKTGGVLYLAAEAEGTLPDRYRAVLGAKFTPGDLRGQRLPFLSNAISFRGLEAMSGALRLGTVRMQQRFDVPLRLVIVDTAAAAFPLANENEQGEVNNLMLSLLTLTKAAGVAVVLVHHFGKNSSTGVRGSSAWTDNSEFILAATGKLDEETGSVSDRKLALTKSRSSATGPLSDFEVQSVQVGQRPDGRRVDAGIINFTAVRQRVGETPTHYEGFMNSAVTVLDDGIVTEVALRAQFVERAAADPNLPKTPDGVDKAFLLARDHALRTGTLEPVDGNPAAFRLRQL
jgi:Bifunctional DNA primase/polymerase, N-terminal/AAA domain